jgi:hypothetical protein
MQELMAVILGCLATTPEHTPSSDLHVSLAILLTRVVDVVDSEHLDKGVVVDEIVQLLGADQERTDDASLVHRLAIVCDATLLDEVDHASGEHLGVDAEVFVIGESCQDSVGNVSDAHLQGGAVFDQVFGDEVADFRFYFRGRAASVLGKRRIYFDGDVDMADVDDAVAEGSRHARVHLS